ncbi:MAG: hypothetical protein ACR2GD_00915 [Pyrinomonadaceae bacterium]
MKGFLLVSLVLCFFVSLAAAQDNPIVKKDLSQAEINRIVKNFTTKEGEFRESLKDYVFNRSAVIQTIGFGGQITGEYRRDSFMTLSPEGVRFEKILYAPVPTLVDLNFTPQDLEDLGGVNPFALDPSVADLYNFNYLGKQKIDELNLYVFDVSPKITPDPKKTKQRFFTGRIWVDDRDLQIVKSKGKAIPEDKNNKYPVVETWRENVDGKYWFPSYSSSDDTLVFDNGQVTKIKMRVKYSDYRQGRTEVRVLDDDTAAQPTPSPTPKKP